MTRADAKHCPSGGHDKPTLVAVYPMPIWAGRQKARLDTLFRPIRVNLTGKAEDSNVINFSGLQEVPELFHLRQVTMDWKDYGAGPLTQMEWISLTRYLRRQNTPIYVGCMGGHGRTGSAIAIMATMLGCVPKGECPVTWVRERYCSHAVEASVQLRYIEQMTGRTVTALASSTPVSTTRDLYYPYGHDSKQFNFGDKPKDGSTPPYKPSTYSGSNYAMGSAADDYRGEADKNGVYKTGRSPRRPKPEDVVVDKVALARSYFKVKGDDSAIRNVGGVPKRVHEAHNDDESTPAHATEHDSPPHE